MNKRQAFHVAVMVCAAVVLITACSDDEKDDSSPCIDTDTHSCPPAVCLDASPPTPDTDIGDVCAYDEDCVDFCIIGNRGTHPYCTRSCETSACPTGYQCLSSGQQGRVCIIGSCVSDVDCPVGYTCNTENPDETFCRHLDIGCLADDDCPAGTACIQGQCKILCENDEHCKIGLHCATWPNRRCVECTSALQCQSPFSCEDGRCNEGCIEEDDCRNGYSCESGACQLLEGGGTGTTGDPDAGCEEHTDCEFFCYSHHCTQACEPDDPQSCPTGTTCHSSSLVCRF